MPKTTVLGVRFTEEQRTHLDRVAHDAGMTTSEWAKNRLLASVPNPVSAGAPSRKARPSGPLPDDLPPTEWEKAGRNRRTPRPPTPRRASDPKPSECPHPPGRRIGDQCAACGATVAGKGKR